MKKNTWKNICLSVVVQIPALLSTSYAQIVNPQISNDQTNLYFNFNENIPATYFHVFIDNDNKASTGYSVNGIGADRMLENNGSYKSTANGTSWSWASLQNVVFTQQNNQASWTFPLSLLGVPAQCNMPINVVFGAQGSNGAGDLSSINQYKLNIGANCVTAQSKIAVPSYFYPDCATNPNCYWGQIDKVISTATLSVINPNSGPGTAINSAYETQSKTTQAQGGTVLGYVYTSYGTRPTAEVTADIDKYYSWYNVNGIFLDEGYSTDCTKLQYYQTINNYIKAKGGKGVSVINFGTNTQECYVNATDIVLEFESDYNTYINWKPSGWETKYPTNRFWHIIYNTPQTALQSVLSLANQRHAGYVYVTPLTGSNPYNALPPASYWQQEVQLLNPAKH